MYTVKYKPLDKYITRYVPPYEVEERVNTRHLLSREYFIKRMFTNDLNRARKYTNLGHVKNSIGTNISNDKWKIISLNVEVK